MERLDKERIELLRGWGESLADEPRDELRAAGRAILLLIEEIDRRQRGAWNERSMGSAATPLAAEADVTEEDVQSGLRARLAQLARRRRDDVAGPEPADIARTESPSNS
jgi:hypothetical protein